ncbi:1-phosphofructokinase family hexose kinase [Brevibacterium litoralis]|uniref:1-phosphofructokinase family hexose kinase n=1 Tax=Brevibacterium litoralis TaxID=3138935 RepID=UPI0032EEF0B9
MILTLTVNPSLDRTVSLDSALVRGGVQRAHHTTTQPGGKGVNVSRALAASQAETTAVLPGTPTDPVVRALTDLGIPTTVLDTGEPIRSNVTVTEPDGTTTKINEPGAVLDADRLRRLRDLVVAEVRRTAAHTVVLAGSLPPGAPEDLYGLLTTDLRDLPAPPTVVVDTSGPPLAAALAASPDLVKPNEDELAELLGLDGLPPDPLTVARAAARLVDPADTSVGRVGAVLATLGGAGAVYVDAPAGTPRAFHAVHAPVAVRSTVGAGDSSLAGLLLARLDAAEAFSQVARAVAHGTAAAALPGTGVPALADTTPELVTVTELHLGDTSTPDTSGPGSAATTGTVSQTPAPKEM